MKYTSAAAAKLLKKYQEDYSALNSKQMKTSSFVVATDEDVESARPEYDFAETQAEFERINAAIRKIKHALNVFNSTTVVPGFDMTIDEMLVYLPQLNAHKAHLDNMRKRLPKERLGARSTTKTVVEYDYANYSIEEAQAAYDAIAGELARAQTALDFVNNTETFEIDV